MAPLLQRLTTAIDPHVYHLEPRPATDVPLAIQWLGTAGFRVQSGNFHFWLDPHLSRHTLKQLLFEDLEPDLTRIAADVDFANAVAVGHSHFDHAMDAPAIAKLHNAQVYGASDTLNWCRGYGVPEPQLHELRGEGEQFSVGPFDLRAVKSAHSPFALGHVPFPGRIDEPFRAPAHMSQWRVGPVFGLQLQHPIANIYHVGSAALIEAELKGIRADVVLACTIGRHATPNFTRRVIDALKPRIVIPCHWEQFWRPIDAPVLQIPSNDLAGFLREVAEHPRAPQVRVLPMRGWTTIEAA